MLRRDADHRARFEAESGGSRRYERSMRVGFLTLGDPRRLRTWSGTPYFMGASLGRHVGEVSPLGPLEAQGVRALAAYAKIFHAVSGRRLLPLHARTVADQFAAAAARRTRQVDPDIVVLLASSSAIGGVPDDRPLVYVSDATQRLIEDYYPRYTNLARSARRDAHRLEQAAIERADLLLYASDWAAASAVADYGADPTKVHVVPFGANLEAAPDLDDSDRGHGGDRCRLLLVGVDWKQKGVGIAVEALDRLRAAGIAAELTVCGCEPPVPVERPGLTVIRFLDKTIPAERERMAELYRWADFFLLPTRAECYGIVYGEAAAYGLPSIGTATGGVPSAVREGESGHLLPLAATGVEYAELIASIHTDPARYLALRRSSRLAFEQHFNWDSWGRRAAELIRDLPPRSRQ